jgi:hypothetical protein
VLRIALLLAALAAAAPALAAGPTSTVRVEDVASVAGVDPGKLGRGVVAFADRPGGRTSEPSLGLVPFSEWAAKKPVQRRFLALHPAYEEPTFHFHVHGLPKSRKASLHVYVAEARFLVPRRPDAIDLARYASLDFLERLDPAIKHRTIRPDEAMPLKPTEAHNRRPDRPWCAPGPSLCIASRYDLEGKLPLGIRLANRLREGEKRKIDEFITFQSELRVVPQAELDQKGLAGLTGLDSPVTGAIEQSIFHVNQLMQFGKLLAVFQRHPGDAGATVVTAFIALAVETDLIEKKREYENVPVLRNLVPVQVLVGKSSFNSGGSISAGLPDYGRNRLRAIAEIMSRE